LKTHHLPLILSLFLGACAPRPAIVPADLAAVDLAPMTLAEAEPAVRESCEQSVQRALLRHGFRVDPVGTHVEIEASFWRDPGVDGLAGSDPLDSSLVLTGTPVSRRTRSTADLTATVHLGSSKQQVLASGTAEDTEQTQNSLLGGGGARRSACAVAADRLADALVEVMTHASR
jgi:hypothetical protein